MKLSLAGALATAVLLAPSIVTAQTPLMDSVKAQFDNVKGVLLKTAEKVPEPIWAFKPTPEVRTFGQIVGHIADANHDDLRRGSRRQSRRPPTPRSP